jgi:hypothetical protein
MMTEISYSGYRFPPGIIQQAIWLYVRFTLRSTLANSYGVGERIRHAVPDMAWNFDSVSVRP